MDNIMLWDSLTTIDLQATMNIDQIHTQDPHIKILVYSFISKTNENIHKI